MATTRKSVRDFLVQQGISNDMIGYNNGSVTVGGKSFMSARPDTDGRTYAPENELARAYSVYDSNKRKETVNQRNNELYNQIGGLREQLTQPQEAFSYNPMTDPQYQAALNQARMNSQQAAGNIAADMNKRGLLNSTITADRGNQAAQREYSRVSDTLLPQLMQQAYQRYQNDRTAQRQALMDQLGLIETQYGMTQQEDANRFRDLSFDRGVYESDRGFDRGVLESDRNFDRGVLESDRNFDRNVFESDRGFNRGVLESDRNFNLSASNAAADRAMRARGLELDERSLNLREQETANTAASREQQQQFENGLSIYQQTGQMPEWMSEYGIDIKGLNNAETKAEVEGLYVELSSGNTTPEQALQRLNDAERLGLKDKQTIDQLRNAVYMLSPESNPEYQREQREAQQRRQETRAEGIREFFTPSINLNPLEAFNNRREQVRKIFGGG